MKKLHTLVRYLDISDGNMQEGSFRCDANVSLRPRGQDTLGTRTEVKNLNSFRFVERAIGYEVERQMDVLEGGGQVVQETRLYDADQDETRPMRSKEEANDYRYFPDPDLLPVELDEGFIESVAGTLPELPDAKRDRFVADYGLTVYDAGVLTSTREQAEYYEAVVQAAGGEPKPCANWTMGDLAGALNKAGIEFAECPVAPASLGALVRRIADGTISGKIAKEVFEALWNGAGDPDQVIAERGLKQVTDTGAIEQLVDVVIAANPQQVEQYRAGKTKVMGFFVGQIMKASKGKANPQQVNLVLKKRLTSD